MYRFLKLFFATSFMLFILFLGGSPVDASTHSGVVESNAPLNVRDSPSDQGAILGKLEPGERIEYFTTLSDWLKITYAGQFGYVSKSYISGTTSSTAEQGVNSIARSGIVASSNGLNVRSGPQSSATIRGQLSSGTPIEFIERNDGWAQITYNGSVGYVYANFLQSATAAPVNAEPVTEQGMTVVLDAGHGGYDPGAVANGLQEKHVAKAYNDQLKQTLEADGIDVVETRQGDEFVSLASRVNQANQAQADLFISIHANSFSQSSVRGFETHYYQSSTAARAVESEISQLSNGNSRGIYQSNFQVLRDTTMPAVLIEVGYLTNPNDASLLQTSEHQQDVSEAVRRAVNQLN